MTDPRPVVARFIRAFSAALALSVALGMGVLLFGIDRLVLRRAAGGFGRS